MYLKVASTPAIQIPSPAPGGPPAASSAPAVAPGLAGFFFRPGLGSYARRRGMGVAPVTTPLAPLVPLASTLLPTNVAPYVPVAASASIQNLTSGNVQNFNPGDSWQITVTGAPNSPVTVQTQLNGAPQPVTSYGNTDQNGQLVLSGTMPASPGQWWQQWSVGGAVAGTIGYNIANPSASVVPTTATATTAATTDASVSPLSFLTDSFSIGTFSFPVWLPVAGIAAWVLMSGHKKGRR
jgi:hypothetical protein